jgi:hypothetical protein
MIFANVNDYGRLGSDFEQKNQGEHSTHTLVFAIKEG